MNDAHLGFFAIGVFVGIAITHYQYHRREKREDQAQREIYKAHFVAGLNAGTRNHAIWIRNNIGNDINGFAISCDKCGAIFATLTAAGAEYCTCPGCQHRNPAPLGIETTTQKESPPWT